MTLSRALLLGKPYFGPAMAARQGPPHRHAVLNALARGVIEGHPSKRIKILEIGSWAGASAVTFGAALRSLGRAGEVVCVDHWEPYFDPRLETGSNYIEMSVATKDQAIFQLFKHNIAACQLEEVISWRRGPSFEILPTLESGSFDLIYIDGSHQFNHVQSDIINAQRLIAEGGVICGDDLELNKSEVDAESHQAFLKSGLDFVQDPRTGTYYHPGVTEAVHERFSQASNFRGVWAIRNNEGNWVPLQALPENLPLPPHIESDPEQKDEDTVTFIGESERYNIVQYGKTCIAVAKALGPCKLFQERLGERELVHLLLKDSNLAQLHARIESIEKQSLEKHSATVVKVGETRLYNLVNVNDYYLAVKKELGRVLLMKEKLGERGLGHLLIKDSNLNKLRTLVEVIENISESVP